MNTHLSIALHALTLLADRSGGLTSEVLAAELDTNPVFLRRVLKTLKAADIITMRRGARGGISLSRPADTLRLDEVYQVICAGRSMFPMHAPASPGTVPSLIGELFEGAEMRAIRHLGRFTLRDLLEESLATLDEAS